MKGSVLNSDLVAHVVGSGFALGLALYEVAEILEWWLGEGLAFRNPAVLAGTLVGAAAGYLLWRRRRLQTEWAPIKGTGHRIGGEDLLEPVELLEPEIVQDNGTITVHTAADVDIELRIKVRPAGRN